MAVIDKLSGSKVRIEVTVSAEEFESALAYAYDQIKDKVEVKGFRKGKVTQAMYEKQFGVESLYEEAVNYAMSQSYYESVTSNNVEVVAQPKIDFDITKVKKGEGFTFVAEVAVKPEVTLGEYKGLEFKELSLEVADAEVDAEVAKLLEQNAELVVKEEGSLENGDTAIFDFEGFVDGEAFEGGKAEGYELKIGSGQFIPGFEDGMLGLAIGESRDVDVTFPEEYQAENLKGKAAVFKVTLHEIKQLETPELTDEFVASLDKEGITTVDALKADTLSNLQEAKVKQNDNAKLDFAVEKATENASFDLPEEMVENEKNRMMDNVAQQAKQYNLELEQYLQFSGLTREAFEENLRKDAKKSVSYNLVIEAISKAEAIECTKEELDAKYGELATQYNMSIEQIQAAAPEDSIKYEVIYKKTLDFLVENLKLV